MRLTCVIVAAAYFFHSCRHTSQLQWKGTPFFITVTRLIFGVLQRREASKGRSVLVKQLLTNYTTSVRHRSHVCGSIAVEELPGLNGIRIVPWGFSEVWERNGVYRIVPMNAH